MIVFPTTHLRLGAAILLASAGFGSFAKDNEASLEKRFSGTVQPFLQNYCLDCHDKETTKGNFDLSPYTSMATVNRDAAHWEAVLDRLKAKEMPPQKSKNQPDEAARKAVMEWIGAARKFEADRNAGDPGPVLARRLSNAEYDNTIRDLTGADIRPTREFPVDPANQAGFDNTGESLTMSPALLKKYYLAAKEVSDHMVLQPGGIDFATHPMLVETDRDKYAILRIVDFYQSQPTDFADYFEAAWRYKYRAAFGDKRASLAQVAADLKVSPKYLATIWKTLEEAKEEVGPIATLQAMWKALPEPKRGPAHPANLREACVAMRDFVVPLRQKIRPVVPNLSAPQINDSAQALVLWKDREWAKNRRKYDPRLLQVDGVVAQISEGKKTESYNHKKIAPKKREADDNLHIPSDPAQRAKYEAAFARFADVFPDAFYVKERARSFVDPEEEKANGNVGRLLSAGLHNMTGYFRDDGPLYDMILDEAGQRQLDTLWDDFNVIASVPQRMHQSTVYFERTDSHFLMDAEFDFARAEDKDVTSEAKVKKLGELYYAKAKRLNANEAALAAIKDHFERVVVEIARVEKLTRDAEPIHLRALETFAERAYRRPLAQAERAGLQAFYKLLRANDGLSHEDAMRDTVASILMSPNFCYRVDLVAQGKKARPLDDYALASRLSYFLWASMPDAELLARAAAGDLHQPKVLKAQAQRMLKDARARGLATEFLANWLDVRRFEEWNSVDRERFPQFDNALRQAMFEEPVRFFQNMTAQNASALDLLFAKYTFVNPALAKHYEMPAPERGFDGGSNEWVRVDNAADYGRGGLLPMAAFLTKNSPGLRTSPVKRGFWVVRRVLGEHIPPPPPTVPELPADEAKLGELTLRDALARHREDKACAGCHAKFDSFGLVFEGFGAIGERRAKDFGGKPVDNRAPFPGGEEKSGVEGLRDYLLAHREDDFVENLCRQLLAFGLGRTLILSDDSTVREMRAKLASNGYRFNTLVETIVASPQFLNKRGADDLAAK